MRVMVSRSTFSCDHELGEESKMTTKEQKYGASLFIRAPVEIKWGIIQPELSSSGELNCKVLSLPGFPLILATRRELVAKRGRQMAAPAELRSNPCDALHLSALKWARAGGQNPGNDGSGLESWSVPRRRKRVATSLPQAGRGRWIASRLPEAVPRNQADRPGFQRDVPRGSGLTTVGAVESANAARQVGRLLRRLLSAWQKQVRTVRSRIPLCDDSERLGQSRMPHILEKLFPVNPAIDGLPLVVGEVDLARPNPLVKTAERG